MQAAAGFVYLFFSERFLEECETALWRDGVMGWNLGTNPRGGAAWWGAYGMGAMLTGSMGMGFWDEGFG
jgi:hypothetical protein